MNTIHTVSNGPGSYATIIFKDRYGMEGCQGCTKVAAKMDALGPDECEKEFDSLVDDAVKNGQELGWPAMITRPVIENTFRESIALSRKDIARAAKEFETQVQETIEEIQGPLIEHPVGWEISPAVREAHKRLFHATVNTFSLSEKEHHGKGIVTIAGGTKYFACGWMLVYQLRKLGCKLPIQVWHLGKREMDAKQALLMRDFPDVELIDATEVVGSKARILGGWELKIWSILESKFQEVLFLDSDNVPVVDPTYLFDHPSYELHGAVLWPDLLNDYGYDITAEAFQLCGLPVPSGKPKPTNYTPVEGGQLLFNKDRGRVWQALQAVKHLNEHSDFWFPSPRGKKKWYFYGDKSTFYLGFNATKTSYAIPKSCEWFGETSTGGFRQFDLAGNPVFEHRCQPTSKVGMIDPPNPVGLTNQSLFMEAYNTLATKWSGCSWTYQEQPKEAKDLASEQFGIWLNFGLNMPAAIELQRGRVRYGMGYRWSMDLAEPDNPKLILVKAKTFYTLTKNGDTWECPEGRLVKGPPKGFEIEHVGIENYIWCSVYHGNEYQVPDSLEGQTVLDIGAHVGVFSKLCLERGAKVISVEATKKNYDRLVNNLKQYGDRSLLFNRACWRSDVPNEMLLSMTKTGDSGGFSVVATKTGEPVESISLDSLIEVIGPIDLLKIDCESAEWPILLTFTKLEQVKRIVGEWHLARIHLELPSLGIPGLPKKLPDPLGNENFYKRLLSDALGKFGFQVNFTDHHQTKLLGLFFAERV